MDIYVSHQAPLSMGLTRQEYWSGLPFPSPGDFPDRGIEPGSLALQLDSSPFEPAGASMYILYAFMDYINIYSFVIYICAYVYIFDTYVNILFQAML